MLDNPMANWSSSLMVGGFFLEQAPSAKSSVQQNTTAVNFDNLRVFTQFSWINSFDLPVATGWVELIVNL
jgi:hypothetical protein